MQNKRIIEQELKKILGINIKLDFLKIYIEKYSNYLILNQFQIENPLIYRIDFINHKYHYFFTLYREKYILEIIRLILYKWKNEQYFKELKKFFYLEKANIKYNIRNFYSKININDVAKKWKYCNDKTCYISFYLNKNNKIAKEIDYLEGIKYVNLYLYFKKYYKFTDKELKKLKKIENKLFN